MLDGIPVQEGESVGHGNGNMIANPNANGNVTPLQRAARRRAPEKVRLALALAFV
jgi:hypothetical protein